MKLFKNFAASPDAGSDLPDPFVYCRRIIARTLPLFLGKTHDGDMEAS
jgi:hypothetical protein